MITINTPIQTPEIILSSKSVNNFSSAQDKTILLLKKGIWIYFFLIIFEGALRKWIIPGLASPLLIVRDPIAFWLLFTAWNRGILPSTPYLPLIFGIGIISIFTALIFGHGNFFVALFGARILLLNFPLIFVIGRVFNRNDLLKLGNYMLWMALPMLCLIALQFYSPQSAWVNRGVGGDMNGAGFSGAMGFYRPPGTFSFTTGTTTFFCIVNIFVLYFWFSAFKINRILLISATIAVILAIPFSMSRGYFYQLSVSLVFFVLASLRKPQYLGKMLFAALFLAIALTLLSPTKFFIRITEPLLARFDNAAQAEGGVKGTLGNRYLGLMGQAVDQAFDKPFFGYGIGMGTNVGASLITGSQKFLISEEEWGRLIGECGAILGLSIILIRVSLVIKIARASYNKMTKGDLLPWLLLSYGALILANGQWAQPTALGFSVLLGGLMLSAIKVYA